MNLELDQKIVLVTGASSGIGAACVLILAEEGADVAVGFGQNIAGATAVAGNVETAGRRAWLCPMDMCSADSVSAAISELGRQTGGLDAAVLCAGENIVTPFDELSPEEWSRVVDTNLNGTYRVLHMVRPLLRAGSAVVIVSSVAAHTGAPHHAHYAAAKAGLVNLTKSAARAWAPEVRVNCVAPGITLTRMGEKTVNSLPSDYATTKLLTGRYATPEEIARVIVFFVSPVAGFTSGATIDCNGGRYLR